ncbi:MAG: hypothetical protein ACP5TV_05090 [Anaerolineae bacterium]
MLNDIGRFIKHRWHEIPSHFPNVRLGAFVIMPNHIHGIIIITGVGAGLVPAPVEYIRSVKQGLWPPFHKRLWQRNYYERIIRNERELAAIQQYIRDNPANWKSDAERPTLHSVTT